MSKKTAFYLDSNSGLPIYTQLVNQIQSRIAHQEMSAGEQLPTIRALAKELGINFNTVARAYHILDKARIISAQQGRGTYIVEISSTKTRTQMRTKVLQALSKKFIAEAQHLGFTKQEITLAIKENLKA